MTSLPFRNNTWTIAAKKYGETDIKFFDPFYFCLFSLLCAINFFGWYNTLLLTEKDYFLPFGPFQDFFLFIHLFTNFLSKLENFA